MHPWTETRARSGRALLLGLCATVASAAAAAAPPEPTGLGKLRFGMSVAAVQKIYPKMEALALERNLGVGPLGGPHVKRFLLPKQTVAGAPQPVDVEIRFWQDKLWMINVYFGVANGTSVMAALSKQYGPPTNSNAQSSVWNGKTSVIFVEHAAGQYTLQDMALMKEAQAYVLDLLRQGRPGEALPADTAREVGAATLKEPAPAAATAVPGSPVAAPAAAATPKPTAGSPG